MALSRMVIVRALTLAAPIATILASAGMAHGQTAPAARQLADTVLGSGSGVSGNGFATGPAGVTSAPAFVASGGALYFRAGTSSTRNDLFRTEGRPGTTTRVFSGITSNFEILKDSPSSAVVFLAQPTGSPAGMYAVSDLSPSGVMLAAGATIPGTQYTWSEKKVPTLQGKALFIAPGTTGPQVWITDGSVAGTVALTSLIGGTVRDIATTSTMAYFLVSESRPGQLPHVIIASDGTSAGTRVVWQGTAPPNWASSGVPPLATSDDAVFFAVQGPTGFTIFTHSVDRGLSTNITMPGFTLSNAFVWTSRDGSGIYFERTATNPTSGSRKELWRFAANEFLSGLLIDFPSDTTLTQLGATNGITLFGDARGSYANTPTLWITDGTPQGTFGIPGFMTTTSADQSRTPGALTQGSEFWFNSTSTTAGVEPACMNLADGSLTRFDLLPGSASSVPGKYTSMGHSHGTAFTARSNTSTVIMAGSTTTTPRTITSTAPYVGTPMGAVGNRLVFWAQTTNGQGVEPHVIDLCPADYDNSGTISTVDLFDYINDFMAGSPKADTDGPGTPPNTTDLIQYLNSWFVGC